MDINLPGLNGFDALGLLRENPDTAHVPVFALSAAAMPSDIQNGLDAGFNRYITKPIDLKQFIKVVKSIEDFWLTIVKLPPNGDK